ncbi:putative DNA-binding transcriptional regulator [Enterobacter cloacae]|uniref:YfeC-like transcriptional regulator n=1 Tax=Enterobacter TaxID=547 RepID=UPI000682B00E|nr:YfeC-like transcriptional regulator [Enterobacter cloacae]ELK7441289.1 putative DNA-binding transcriptional regulator [Enterobacter cloacae]MBA7850583.1 putative DNA-binding transcriptional regulator [Enterobacter cloacae]MCK7414921.1 putative DNA-binding transcriptional regulator [Enterobacter cloacae]MCK7439717.1 putative DNA-binding transcriptional regulator [Enterobacter cloacae]MCU6202531.1 putative DNA-binding transcriptional regulator [Enterobacter cloacae]
MKRLRSKMTTEELANSLGVARQTVNRWIRQQGWKTEGINGVKGGRARLIHIDARVKEHIMSLPAIRNRQAVYHLAEVTSLYGESASSNLLPQIVNTLENMTRLEQERLDALLKREGISGFLTRLGIAELHA